MQYNLLKQERQVMQTFCLMRKNHWVITDYPVTLRGGMIALLWSLLKLHTGPGFIFLLQGLYSDCAV